MSPDLKVLEGTARTLLAEAVDGWLKELHAAGRRVSTVQSSYGYPLRSLCLPFCDRRGVSEVAQVTNGLLADFTIHLCDERGPKGQLSEASIHTYLRPINQVLKWAREQGHDVGARASLPKLERRTLATLSRDEIQRIEDACKAERSKLGVRVLADTGLRVELCGLRTGDLISQGREHYLHVRKGKGGNGRLVPLPRLHVPLRKFAQRGRPHDLDKHTGLGIDGAWEEPLDAVVQPVWGQVQPFPHPLGCRSYSGGVGEHRVHVPRRGSLLERDRDRRTAYDEHVRLETLAVELVGEFRQRPMDQGPVHVAHTRWRSAFSMKIPRRRNAAGLSIRARACVDENGLGNQKDDRRVSRPRAQAGTGIPAWNATCSTVAARNASKRASPVSSGASRTRSSWRSGSTERKSSISWKIARNARWSQSGRWSWSSRVTAAAVSRADCSTCSGARVETRGVGGRRASSRMPLQKSFTRPEYRPPGCRARRD